MPLVPDVNETDAIEMEELVAFIRDNKVDTRSEADMLACASGLQKLGNNRSFVADIALRDLKARNDIDASAAVYGPQTIMLHYENDANFYLRANFWPSPQDHIFKSSEATAFFYHVPHDHSFNFLTVGYLGPGYQSNYYEYEYGTVDGYPGEKVDLKFVEYAALNQGKVMLYRAFRDVHDQRPGDAMSMSLNIMENSLRGGFMDQYNFNTERGEVTDLINRIAATSLLPLLAATEDEDAVDFLIETARAHRSGRVPQKPRTWAWSLATPSA
jgi:hypothetical protein